MGKTNTAYSSRKELKSVVKESLREVLTQELMRFRALLLPAVSSKEQRDIEKRYGKPSHKAAKTLEVKI
jgi:hypothetical protein